LLCCAPCLLPPCLLFFKLWVCFIALSCNLHLLLSLCRSWRQSLCASVLIPKPLQLGFVLYPSLQQNPSNPSNPSKFCVKKTKIKLHFINYTFDYKLNIKRLGSNCKCMVTWLIAKDLVHLCQLLEKKIQLRHNPTCVKAINLCVWFTSSCVY
jgi:hypothetical protein